MDSLNSKEPNFQGGNLWKEISPMTSASKPIHMGNKVLKPFDGINQWKPTKGQQQPMKARSCDKYQA